jgi:hypothetical protein
MNKNNFKLYKDSTVISVSYLNNWPSDKLRKCLLVFLNFDFADTEMQGGYESLAGQGTTTEIEMYTNLGM